jgi:hypothetical protein
VHLVAIVLGRSAGGGRANWGGADLEANAAQVAEGAEDGGHVGGQREGELLASVSS